MRKNLLKNEHLASTVQIVLGCALGALAYPLFLYWMDRLFVT